MLRETASSVRRYFGILAVLFILIAAGASAEIAIALREHPGVRLSRLFLATTTFNWLVAFAFIFAAVKFPSLIKKNPQVLKGILHARFWGSIAFVVAQLINGSGLNPIGLVISVFVYVYLLKSIDRLASEALAVPPGHIPTPTL